MPLTNRKGRKKDRDRKAANRTVLVSHELDEHHTRSASSVLIMQPEENDDVYITSEQPGKEKYESLKKRLKTEDGGTTVSKNSTNDRDCLKYRYVCGYCGLMYCLQEDYLHHLKVEHGCDNAQEELEPSDSNTNKNAPTQTERNKNVTSPLRIDMRSWNFAAEESVPIARLNTSALTNTQKNKFRCDTCGMGFTKSNEKHVCKYFTNFKRLQRLKEDEAHGKTSAQENSVKVPRTDNIVKKPYKCAACGKAFIQVNSLEVHLNTHIDLEEKHKSSSKSTVDKYDSEYDDQSHDSNLSYFSESSDSDQPCKTKSVKKKTWNFNPRASNMVFASDIDSRKHKEMNIAISVEDIIHMSVEEFNPLLLEYNFSQAQLALIKKIRRRGKNKLAAQTCRQRKLELIDVLASQVEGLRKEKSILVKSRREIYKELQVLKGKFNHLHNEVLKSLKDDSGRPYNSDEYTLQIDTCS